MSHLLADLITDRARGAPDRVALVHRGERLTYAALAEQVAAFAGAVVEGGLDAGARVGVFLEKRFESVVAMFGAAAAGAAFVPINPLLRPRQVAYILRDCGAQLLVTSAARLAGLLPVLEDCPDLRTVVVVDAVDGEARPSTGAGPALLDWRDGLARGARTARGPHRRIDTDMVAILYTSGSTGMPKGVVLSHRNMVAGARSVAEYLGNHAEDRLLAALPLSFDAGFSQLTTAFAAGASVVLINYLVPRDVTDAIAAEGVTGLTGVPPLYVQLSHVAWPESAVRSLRYIANTGGTLPQATLARLRAALPETRVFLMYGLTEAFRSTYLPPEELDRRPGSIGKAIPNAEILVVDRAGRPCRPGDVGELVHRGALVSLGYWDDLDRTRERFRPAPAPGHALCLPEIAVWSGDLVRQDEDGFLYFVGRRDDMIKTSGNRVSPTEIEEVLYASGLVGEAVVVGAPHAELGQAVVTIVAPPNGSALDHRALLAACRKDLPAFMVPQLIVEKPALPRNPNGKIDRSSLRAEVADAFAGVEP